jgi:hypothetical protein
MRRMGERSILELGRITLEWCEWTPWLKVQKAGIPAGPGVYEVRHLGRPDGERLYIGMGKVLRRRAYDGMIKNSHHGAGEIAQMEDLAQVAVRWATTDRPAAAEEELLRTYLQTFGELPKYAEKRRRRGRNEVSPQPHGAA